MIIKGFLRRYERWNPVHPTIGAFWGMGLGLGCGIGWGPGFGPEVIGYVGAGCGVGFNVGFTFAGLGIGLPANYLFRLPYSVIVAARRNAGQLGDVSPRNVRASGWSIVPHVSVLHSEAVRRLSGLRGKRFLEASSNLFDSKTIPWRSESIWKSLSAFGDRVFHPHRGPRIYCKCTLEFTTPGLSNLAFDVHRRTAAIPAEQKVQHCFAQKIEEKELRAQEGRGGSEIEYILQLTRKKRQLYGQMLGRFSNHGHSVMSIDKMNAPC